MKKLLKVLILLPLLSLVLYGQNLQDVTSGGTVISVPDNWIVNHINENNISYIIYITNDEGTPTGENVNLSTVDIGIELNDELIGLTLNGTLAYLEGVYDSIDLIDRGQDFVYFNGTTQGLNLTQKLKIFYKGTSVYTLTFTTFNGTFDNFIEVFEKIEDSFRYE